MDSTLWVLVYSRFSPACLKLMQMIDQSGLEITFQVISIDDKKMRERIKKDTRYNINYVPCILKIDKINGIASQYEADKAFLLIQDEINQLRPPRPQQHAQVSFQPLETENDTVPIQNKQAQPQSTPIEELMDLPETRDVDLDRPMGERRNVEKISVANVMAGREVDMDAPSPVPPMDIKPVRTGKKVNVNEIMDGKM